MPFRQKFTQKERDIETGLDYFGARYYGATQGRFTSPDPLNASGRPMKPQSWNRYSYVLNRPLSLIDPTGMHDCTPKTPCIMTTQADAEARTRANPELAVVQEKVTVTSEREPISTTAIEIFNSSITPRATEPPRDYSTRVAHDNDDFRQINLSLAPRAVVGGGVHFAFTWDKYGGHYFSVGPTFGIGLPISGNLLTGQTIRDGVHVRDKANVESILTGPTGTANVCPIICMSGSWSIDNWNFFAGPPLPKGGGTMAMGAGTPELSVGKDWTWKLPF